jgi:hypothetical protein
VSLAERGDKLAAVRSTDEHVEQAVAAKLDAGTRWLLRREIQQLPGLLPAGEEILILAQGRVDGGTGMIVVTDARLMFFEQGVSHRRVENVPYFEIERVEADVSVVSSDLSVSRFVGEGLTIGRVYPKPRTMEIAEYIDARASAPGEPGHTLGRQPGPA